MGLAGVGGGRDGGSRSRQAAVDSEREPGSRPGDSPIGILDRARQSAKLLLNLRLRPPPRTLEEQVYASAVREGDACLDIGANVGWIALFLARTAGPEGHVIAFEPVWPTYRRMCRNIQATINVRAPIYPVPMGVADADRVATVHVPRGRPEAASIAMAADDETVPVDRYECRFVTLDGFLSARGEPPGDFWKIDVEGAELMVVRGASGLFADGHRPMIAAEVFAPWQRRCGYEPWDLLGPMLDLGYQFLFLCPGGLVEHRPRSDQPFPAGFEDGYNLLAYVPGRHDDRLRALGPLRAGTGRALRVGRAPRPNQ